MPWNQQRPSPSAPLCPRSISLRPSTLLDVEPGLARVISRPPIRMLCCTERAMAVEEARPSYPAHDLIDTKSRVILRRKARLAKGDPPSGTRHWICSTRFLQSKGELGVPNEPEILTGDAGCGASDFMHGAPRA